KKSGHESRLTRERLRKRPTRFEREDVGRVHRSFDRLRTRERVARTLRRAVRLQILQRLRTVRSDRLGVPQISELKGTWTVEIRLVDVQHEALDESGISIGFRYLRHDAAPREVVLVDHANTPIDSHGDVHPRNQEQQARLRIRLEVLIALKELVAADVGN